MESEPWDWIPHVDGADRQKEINAHLLDMLNRMPINGPMMRWNPNSSRMEPYNGMDDLGGAPR